MSELHIPRRRPAALGRGLNALLGDVQTAEGTAAAIREVPLGLIVRNATQPRRHFDDDALGELAQSIATHGVLQPIILRELPAGNYEIIAGERRWRASQRAGRHDIPAIIRSADEQTKFELALLENIQREQLNALEEGEAFRRLMDDFGYSVDDVAKVIHKSRSHVANQMRLIDLPDTIRTMVAQGDLTMGHARALLGVNDAVAIAERARDEKLSVREVEKLARARKKPTVAPPPLGQADADIALLERQLGDLVGLKVSITHEGRGGSVRVDYATLDQLDLICQRLSGERI